MSRRYYSERAGRGPAAAVLGLNDLKRLFASQFSQWESEGYFQEYLGYYCVDAGFVPGLLGTDLQAELLLALRKPDLWPVESTITDWSEDDLFDMVEFLHDHCSKPTKRTHHDFSNCGWHCSAFSGDEGKAEYRQRLNRLLNSYDSGFEISEDGEVRALPPTGLELLVAADAPTTDPDNVNKRIESAIRKFRRHRSSFEDRRDAVRDLVDVLEFLRPQIKKVLKAEDERDLFNIANNFGIRHHRQNQKTDYDKAVWLSWMFYFYLSTIHAVLHLLKKDAGEGGAEEAN